MARGADLVFDVYPFVPPQAPKRTVTVLSNDRVLATWILATGDWTTRDVVVPPDLTGTQLHLDLHEDEARSPRDLGLSEDPRHLGIAVRSIKVLEPP